jgi:signal transduction histidine kinase
MRWASAGSSISRLPTSREPGDHLSNRGERVGTGIAAEHLSKVMAPFFSTKPLSIGSGLGLAQVSGFAQQSGGSLPIASVVGKGTTATLLLPRRERTV